MSGATHHGRQHHAGRRRRHRPGGAPDGDEPVGDAEPPGVGDAVPQPAVSSNYAAAFGSHPQGDEAGVNAGCNGVGAGSPTGDASRPSMTLMSPMTYGPAGFSVPVTTTGYNPRYGQQMTGMNYGCGNVPLAPMSYGPQSYGYAMNPLAPFGQQSGIGMGGFQSPWTLPRHQVPLQPGDLGALPRHEVPLQPGDLEPYLDMKYLFTVLLEYLNKFLLDKYDKQMLREDQQSVQVLIHYKQKTLGVAMCKRLQHQVRRPL